MQARWDVKGTMDIRRRLGLGAEISPKYVTVKTESRTIIREFSLREKSYWTDGITYYVTELHLSF